MSAQAAAKAATEQLIYVGCVLPYKPPIDKIVAVMLANQVFGSVERIAYWKRNECSNDQFKKWAAQGFYPIDIGERKYNQRTDVGSATEFVVKDLEIQMTPGKQRLLELVNENNKTGKLKGHFLAIPHLLRQMYELSGDDDFHIDIIEKAAHVAQMFAEAKDGVVTKRSIEDLETALPDLVDILRKCGYAPFTLGGYMRDLWMLNYEPAEIRERIEFWLDGWNKVQAETKRATEALETFPKEEFRVNGYTAVTLRTDDRFLVNAAIKSRKYDIRLVISKTGNVTISTNSLKLENLAKELQKLEPGQWYWQKQMGSLINGGVQYVGVEATSLAPVRLVQLMHKFIPAKAKSVG